MNATSFLESFGHILNAPDGINRVRDVVLSLAFEGKLAKYSNAHVDDLLTSIDELEPRSKRRPQNVTSAETGYHSIPSHWRWVAMDRIGHDWGQTKPISDFTYIDVSSIDNKRGVISESAKLVTAAAAPSRARKIVKKGTVIYSTVRPYLRNIAVVDQDFEPKPIASTAFAILHPFEGVEAKYIYYYLRSPAFVTYVESVQSGIAYPAISDRKFFAGMLPLPPLEEQKRIVAKVDELMALCDKLEAQQQERERRFPVLSRACHAHFVESPTLGNLKAIFDVTQPSVDDLRNTVLDLAILGHLSHQNSDEVAKDPFLSELKASTNTQLESPVGWKQCRYQDLTELVTSGSRGWKQYYSDAGAFFIRAQNSKTDTLLLNDVAYVNLPENVEGKRAKVKQHDILVTITGANVTKTALVEEEFEEAYISQHIALTRPHFPEMSRWLHLCFLSPAAGRGKLEELAYGDKPGLNLANIRNLVFPIPPIAEQRRIVAQVGRLMALLDQLEKQQNKKTKVAKAFAQAAVSAITGTEIKEPEKMKAPKTELVSRLQTNNKPSATDQAPLADLLSKHKGDLPAKTLWQQSGLEIDTFYQQLRTEMANGWIVEPEKAVINEVDVN